MIRRLSVFGILAFPLFGEFDPGTNVPLDRLIRNVTPIVQRRPDAFGHYLLGRLYSLVFAAETPQDVVPILMKPDAKNRDGLPELAAPYGDGPTSFVSKRPLTARRRQGLHSCLEHYSRAIAAAPKVPLYHYSLGWVREQAAQFARELGPPPNSPADPENARRAWLEQALAEYRTAFRLGVQDSWVPPETTSPI